MKLLYLADANSIHTYRWVSAIVEDDEFEIVIASLTQYETSKFQYSDKVKVISLGDVTIKGSEGNGAWKKLSYLRKLGDLKKLYNAFSPDVVHANYATSYGLLGRLLFPKKLFISVWGSDVFIFPSKSFLHKKIFEFILAKAEVVLSAGVQLAKETEKYTSKVVTVIPFGVDTVAICPQEKKESGVVTLGTIKSLETVYGIDRLIKLFAKVAEVNDAVKLMLVGSGSQEEQLKKLVSDLKIDNQVEFVGAIAPHQVPEYLHKMDVFCALSRSESFGVAILEAQSAGVPVFVSNVGGLPEVVDDGKDGFVVDWKDQKDVMNRFNQLIDSIDLRKELGAKGRRKVLQKYDWNSCVEQLKKVYREAM